MNFDASTPNLATKTKRTISLLSTPEEGGEPKKNRFASDSSCDFDFNYTYESMAEKENVNSIILDDKSMMIIAQTVQETVQKSLSEQLKNMVEIIINGVVDGLSKRIESLENENKYLRQENNLLKDRIASIENELDASEQYSRRNSVRIFGIPENSDNKESTDNVVINLCNALGANITLDEIDRSHRTGKPGGPKPRPILVKFVSYRSRQKLYTKRRDLKDHSEFGHTYINEDLTQHRSQLLYKARGLAKIKQIESAWSSDGNILIRINENGQSKTKRISTEHELEKYKQP